MHTLYEAEQQQRAFERKIRATKRTLAACDEALNNLSDEELDACVKFMDYYYSDDSVDQYGEYYNLPLPKQGKKAPADQVNVDGMLETSNTNGTFTITDQAFPTEVADVLFNAQDAVANDEMTPEEAASNIQKAIEEYQAK